MFVTHDQDEAISIADRVALLIDGRLRQVGLPRSFFEQPADADVVQFFGGGNIIQGVKSGSQVKTCLGNLDVSQTTWPDGDVLLAIHPETIEVGANGHNNLQAQVLSQKYHGPKIQCEFLVNGQTLTARVSPNQFYNKGSRVTIHLPKESIRLLPCHLSS